MDDNPYTLFLESVLTPARLVHSLGVMQVMGELAEVYGLDQETARTIGLLHDAAKDLPPDQQEKLMVEGDIRTEHPFTSNYEYMHGLVGAILVKKELDINNPLILDAITTHTFFGSSPFFHHPLCWCLRFSDIIEPNRDWRAEKRIQVLDLKLKELVYDGKMIQAARTYSDTIIQWFMEKDRSIHPNFYQVKAELGAQVLDDLLPVGQVTTLINQTVDSFPHSECHTCECFLGYVAQLDIDTDPIGKAYLKALIPGRSAMHACLGCDPCPPGDQFAAYLRGETR